MLKGIVSFTFSIWIVYLFWFFIFTNNAEDRIKNLKFEEIVRTHFNENEQEYADSFLKFAKSKDINTNISLTKSLKSIGAKNITLTTKDFIPQVKYIMYNFEYKGYLFNINSKVVERNLIRKEYPGPLSKLLFVETFNCSNGRNTKITNMVDLDNATSLGIMSSLYASPKLHAMDDLIKYVCPSK